MRIYKKRPFSPPNSVKVNIWTQRYTQVSKRLKDLKNLRDTISQDRMSETLYDFINMDGSLDNLFHGLPRPIDGKACESLKLEQLGILDQEITASNEDLKTIFQKMWDAFKEWFMDWWDDCRRRRIELNKLRAAYTSNPNQFGNAGSFGAIQGHIYTHGDWLKMVTAVRNMFTVLRSLPSDGSNLANWVRNNFNQIADNLTVFGQTVQMDPGPTIYKKGVPGFDISRITFSSGYWVFSQLPGDATQAINILYSDEEIRRLFGKIENNFKSIDPDDRYALEFVRDFVWCAMTDAFRVANALIKIFRMAATEAKKKSSGQQA